MSITIYVPGDSGALAVGADRVAEAISAEAAQRNVDIRLVRNGSRGLYWLEPLVEIDTPTGRVAFGPLTPTDISTLFEGGLAEASKHPKYIGPTEDIPFLKSQTRLTFARCGITDPFSLEDYERHGGMAGLRATTVMRPVDIVTTVIDSGLRGRGGAGFPTGIKWKTVLDAAGAKKVIVCNADEGDSGTFADRMIMEGDPFTLIEGMATASLAT
ncbi:MAG: formate dehydrogenase, partial [Proteobacteria bacterium]|nr:formate dehydrogenase [Pseudomonadota bacterium]